MKSFLLLFSFLFCCGAQAQNKIVVRVLDPQNAPIVGANVEVQIWRERLLPVAPQVTGADGNATLDIPNGDNGKPATGSVSVVAPGFAFKSAALAGKDLEVQLQRGVTWRGKAVDEAGKPIEGAKVSVIGAQMGTGPGNIAQLYGEKNRATYSTATGADGSFALENVPAQMKLLWNVEHPNYAKQQGFGAFAEAEMTVKLASGGALKGRVLDLAGQPMPDMMVYASMDRLGGGNQGKTDKNGEFTIPSLAPGLYNIGAFPFNAAKAPDYVLPRVKDVRVEAGRVAEAPTLQAVKGVTIQSTVRDAATQKPLAGAAVLAQADNETVGYGVTDAAGNTNLQVMAGRYKVYISGPPSGYIRPEEQKTVIAGEANTAPVVFELKKSTILRGTIVDEAGKPLQTKLKVDYDSSIESNAKGEWEFAPHSERKLRVAGGETNDTYLEVISPKTIEIGTDKAITIVLRPKPWQVLPGRALTTDGKPLEGARIEASFYTPQGEDGSLTSNERTAISNANGDFVVPRILEGLQAGYFNLKGKKEGYAFREGGELSKNGPVWKVSDLVFAPLNLQVEGKTVPGARVTIAGAEVVASADGSFKLTGLPATSERVWAFKGGDFGGAEAKSPAQIELAPQGLQGRDPDLARDIWNDIVNQAQRGNGEAYYQIGSVQRSLNRVDSLDFATQLEKATGDMALATLAESWAGKVDFATLEPAFTRIKDPDRRVYTYLNAAAKSDDKALGERALQEADANFKVTEKEVWWRETNLYRAVAVEAKFRGEKAGIAALDRAVVFTLKNHGAKSTRRNNMPNQTGRDEMMALGAELVAPGGLTVVRRLIENIEPGSGYEVMALGTAIPILARNGAPESVLPLFDELEKMPEPPRDPDGSIRSDMMPTYAFSSAANKVVPLLGVKSPQKALELARRVDASNGDRWQALARAAQFQTPDVATKLWREIVTGANSDNAPRFAARAWEFDPKLGRELFEIARQKVEVESKNEWQGKEIWGGFGFYFARADAAQSRFLIEREWGLARQKKTEGDQLGALALAMAATDAPRAWQMAREIPAGDNFASFEARRKIGLYLAASDEKRRDFPFSRNNWEEWRALDQE